MNKSVFVRTLIATLLLAELTTAQLPGLTPTGRATNFAPVVGGPSQTVQQAYFKSANLESGDQFGVCVAISGDTAEARTGKVTRLVELILMGSTMARTGGALFTSSSLKAYTGSNKLFLRCPV